uniref:Putative secreted protein n=1 Tax=Psorophora albipes TaxID=869069 RepID=T1DJ80_9DIPT
MERLLVIAGVFTAILATTAVIAFPNHRNGTADLPSGQWNETDNADADGTVPDAGEPSDFDPSWRNSSEPIQPRPFCCCGRCGLGGRKGHTHFLS